MSNILSNVEWIRSRVAEAARRAGRNPTDVTIIAVSKTRTVAEIQAVLAAGMTQFGENRVQELKEKWPAIETEASETGAIEIGKTGNTGDTGESGTVRRVATWHLIGSLQTNKVKLALEMADLIHSLDRDSLAEELAKQAERRGAPCRVLIEVNVSGEASKSGISPAELPGFLRRISERGHILVEGLMTMAPLSDDPEAARPHFRRLRQLAIQLRGENLPGVNLQHLSMGMSGDFEVAIEEGATLVRIGTAIFGARV